MKAVLTTLFTLPQVAAEIPKLLMKKTGLLISPVRNLLSFGMLLKRGHIHKTAEAAGYTRLSTIS